MKKTLWISILGFSSGSTGLVLTDKKQPYTGEDLEVPVGKEHDVVCRFDKRGVQKILRMAKKAARIRIMSYGKKRHKTISLKTLRECLNSWNIWNDMLTDYMPNDKQGE